MTVKRQEAGRRGHTSFLDDDRAIVQRRSRLEDRDQQIVGERRVERDAALDVVAQSDLALDRDDRPNLLRGKHGRRDDQLLNRLVVGFLAVEIAEERRLSEMRERAADVRLENHDRRKGDVDQHVPDHPVDGLQRRQPRDVEQADDDQRPGRHLHGARAPDQLQELVDQDRDDRDVQDVPPANWRTAEPSCEVFGHWPR